MRTAGIVADHPTERAAILGRGIGREEQSVRCGGGVELSLDYAGLNDRDATVRVDAGDRVHVFREIEYQRGVGGLPAERRTAAAREDRDRVLARQFDRADRVALMAWNDDADWDAAVVGRVGRIDRAGGVVETDVTLDRGGELVAQCVDRSHRCE